MKRKFFLLAVIFFFGTAIQAQVHCPMPCESESFPYLFCTLTGTQIIQCSTNPNSMPGLVPAKSKIPGCVTVEPLDPSDWYQPTEGVPEAPTPPDKETIFEFYSNTSVWPPPWSRPYSGDEGDWGNDESAYEAGLAQWNLDSVNFFSGLDDELIDTTGFDPTDSIVAERYYTAAYYSLFNEYNTEESQYLSDSTAHAEGTDVNYHQVWDHAEAQDDAQKGLNAWLAICNLQGDPNCCIVIKPDDYSSNWQGQYDPTQGATSFPLAKEFGNPLCPDDNQCPDTNYRYIIFNATNKFLYQNNQNRRNPNPAYILHEVPTEDFFTGLDAPSDVYPSDNDFSFRDVAAHEIGHWLGMQHPDTSVNGAKCVNNYNNCKDSIPGYRMLMGDYLPHATSAQGLSYDDKCMFSKLYCPSSLPSGVKESDQPEPPPPEVYPNPTSGGMTLTFTVSERNIVRVSIYDMLGNPIREIVNDIFEPSSQSISLGTESLPTGNYVCRVRVGDRVSYLNVEVRK